MKKLLIVLCIAVVAIIIVLTSVITKFQNNNGTATKSMSPTVKAGLPPNGITLNGLSAADANSMVTNFITDPTSSHAQTAIWLDKAWVDNISNMIAAENGDGIRIYFAKRKDNKNNTVVIVSTYRSGTDLDAESFADHHDYYTHKNYLNFLQSSDAKLTEDWGTDPGASLFAAINPCQNDNCVVSVNGITCNNAYVAVKKFKNQFGGTDKTINTDSEWFSLDVLQDISKQLGLELKADPANPADGIRIYFGYHTATSNPNHPNRHAFIIVTTKTDNSTGTAQPRKDNYYCYAATTVKRWTTKTDDNGEQCLNNCTGATLPAP